MKQVIFLVYIGIVALFSSCMHSLNPCIQGNDTYISENRSTMNFNDVHVSGDFNVYISQDSVNSIRVEAEENLLPYIETTVKGNTLKVNKENKRCFKNHRPIKVFITTTGINGVNLSGSGFINFTNISADYFDIDLSGSGDIIGELYVSDMDVKISGSGEVELEGEADNSNMKISGSGNIRSYSLEQHKCFTNISGSGDMYVNVSDLLDVKISGSGFVHYVGYPAINTSITGSGNVFSNN